MEIGLVILQRVRVHVGTGMGMGMHAVCRYEPCMPRHKG